MWIKQQLRAMFPVWEPEKSGAFAIIRTSRAACRADEMLFVFLLERDFFNTLVWILQIVIFKLYAALPQISSRKNNLF